MKKIISLIIVVILFNVIAYADYSFSNENLSYVKEIPNEGLKYEIFSENGKYGMKKYGNIIIPAIWDEFGTDNRPAYPPYGDFSHIAVRDNEKWGAVNEKGEIIIPVIYKEVVIQPKITDRFEIRVQDFNDKYGFVDYNGKIIAECKYDYCESSFIDGMCVVGRDFGYTVIDKEGNELMPLISEKLTYYNGKFVVEKEEGSYILDKNGNILLKSDYDYLCPTSVNTVIATKNNKQGLIDFSGNILIPLKYNAVVFMGEKNIYLAMDNTYDYYYDINLNLIREPSEKMSSHHSGNDNLLTFKKNGKIGIITTDGKQIAPCIYEDFYSRDGYFMVRLNGLVGILNPDGTYHTYPTIRMEALYNTEHLGDGFFAVMLSPRKWAVLNNKGEFITRPVFPEVNVIDNKIVVSDNSKWYEIKFEDKITPVNNSSYMTELYEKEINYLSEKGIIIGNENGELNLYNQITRAEFLTMIIRSLSCDIKECDAVFSDISNHWAKNIVMKCYNAGIVKGYEDNTFKPDQIITYEEMLQIAIRSMGVPDYIITRENSIFPIAKYAKLLPVNTTFSSNETILKNKACVIIYNLINTDITKDDIINYKPNIVYNLGN
ncbi:MAG: hypothetical protein E7419_01820 [Ruminococcaceae bacterium]|nr:hypothetical protein [Oscillospiraceae bacterium]